MVEKKPEDITEDDIKLAKDLFIQRAQMFAESAEDTRREFLNRLYSKEITLDQLIQYSKDPKLKALKKIKLVRILGNMPHWTLKKAQKAFTEHGLPHNLSINAIQEHNGFYEVYTTIIEASPQRYRQRPKSPTGWPWKGNILAALEDMGKHGIPRDIEKSVRYHFTGSSFISDESDIVHDPIFSPQDDEAIEENRGELDDILDMGLLEEDDDGDKDNTFSELDELLGEEDDYGESDEDEELSGDLLRLLEDDDG